MQVKSQKPDNYFVWLEFPHLGFLKHLEASDRFWVLPIMKCASFRNPINIKITNDPLGLRDGTCVGCPESERREAGPGRCLRDLYESHSEPVSFSAPHSSPAGRT